MDKLTQQIRILNTIYSDMDKNYSTLKSMFKNHSGIKQKFILSEQILLQGFLLLQDKIEFVETKRKFNRIIKKIRAKNV
jgi:hypothetical protein